MRESCLTGKLVISELEQLLLNICLFPEANHRLITATLWCHFQKDNLNLYSGLIKRLFHCGIKRRICFLFFGEGGLFSQLIDELFGL